jgi:hypothetical protein
MFGTKMLANTTIFLFECACGIGVPGRFRDSAAGRRVPTVAAFKVATFWQYFGFPVTPDHCL